MKMKETIIVHVTFTLRKGRCPPVKTNNVEIQSADVTKYLGIGNYPRRTPIPLLHSNLNIPPIREFIYLLTDKFFTRCLTHPNPLISSIVNYSLADLHCQYKKYIHKRPKHILL
jgi:hypothetical protein